VSGACACSRERQRWNGADVLTGVTLCERQKEKKNVEGRVGVVEVGGRAR
jgi:hypothetical protein